DGDEPQLDDQAERVADHRRQRSGPPKRYPPADDEHHARPRDEDKRVDDQQKAGEVAGRKQERLPCLSHSAGVRFKLAPQTQWKAQSWMRLTEKSSSPL